MGERLITVETARVFTFGRRRYFTKVAAYRALARAKIAQRCECEASESDAIGITYRGYTCRLHADDFHYRQLVNRLARIYARHDRAIAPESAVPESGPTLNVGDAL